MCYICIASQARLHNTNKEKNMEKKLLERINKLLALSKSPEINEGNLAMEMAQKLMSENGISMSELNSCKLEEELGPISASENHFGTKKPKVWETILAHTIAEHFGCVSFISGKFRDELYHGKLCRVWAMRFVGHEGNRVTCEIMYNWLHKLISKEARKSVSVAREIDSFCYGAAEALEKKYKKQYSDVVSNCPAVVDDVQKWVDDNLNLTSGKKRSLSIYDGASKSGQKMGEGLSLNKQFGLKQLEKIA